jgi:hypothetical protein
MQLFAEPYSYQSCARGKRKARSQTGLGERVYLHVEKKCFSVPAGQEKLDATDRPQDKGGWLIVG